jgi:hypothetical protein
LEELACKNSSLSQATSVIEIAPAAQRKAVENLSVLVTNGDELGQRGGKLPLATSDLYRVKVAV